MNIVKSINKSLTYIEYPYKWVILTIFYLTSFLNGIPYETCVPISKELNYIYGINDSLISFSATGYMLMHPIFSFPASKCNENLKI
jgi:FLVCR family feline leukemia virus subgroup C receptor-related protein